MNLEQQFTNTSVAVIEPDDQARAALENLLASVNIPVCSYREALDYLREFDDLGPHCLITEVLLPNMSGLTLQKELQSRAVEIPIIFVSERADIPLVVKAMKNGACDFFVRPYNEYELLESVQSALILAESRYLYHSDVKRLREQTGNLSQAEMRVLHEIIAGHRNKKIAETLHLSIKTIEFHRANIMKKMQVSSLVELIICVTKLGLINTSHLSKSDLAPSH